MFHAVANRFHGIAIQFQVVAHSHVVDLAHSSSSSFSSSREVDLVSREVDLSASRKMEVTAASVVPKPAARPHPLYGCRRRVPSRDVAPVPVAAPVAVPG